MKAVLRQYMASLKERDELDKILPDILSERGHNILSRPTRGFAQYGADVTSVGPHPITGNSCYFVWSIKSGDLTRSEWDTGDQGLRTSLNQIRDVHLVKHVPKDCEDKVKVVALCFGGEIRENIRDTVDGYIKENTIPGQREYVVWNGDAISDMTLSGIMNESVFEDEARLQFRKAAAFVDEPDVCERHFYRFATGLLDKPFKTQAERLRALRQVYLGVFAVIAGGRDAENYEAAVRCSELALLMAWDTAKAHAYKSSKASKTIRETLHRLIEAHLLSLDIYIGEHVRPYLGVDEGLASSIPSSNAVDINLALFRALGRVASLGYWSQAIKYLHQKNSKPEVQAALEASINQLADDLCKLIGDNAALREPLRDDHAIEVMATCLFLVQAGKAQFALEWLQQIMEVLLFTLHPNGRHPTIDREYSDLAQHPKGTDEDFKRATAASVLIPTLIVWFAALRDGASLAKLREGVQQQIPHCALQLWVPNSNSEAHLCRGDAMHGLAWSPFDVSGTIDEIITRVEAEIKGNADYSALSVIKHNLEPLMVTACLRHRIPLPPQFYANDYFDPPDDSQQVKP